MMSESKRIKVFIVDDHTVVRKGLKALLAAKKYEIDVVGDAESGDQAIPIVNQLEPDVILMDLEMPGMSGIETIKEIKKLQPDSRILVLTSFAEDKKVFDALHAGAYGYLLKDTSPDELVETIRSVYSEKLTLPKEFSHVLLDKKVENSEVPASQSGLTQRELDVLKCIAQGMSNKQIAQELTISTATIRTHVSKIMQKLNLENRTQAALFALKTGLA